MTGQKRNMTATRPTGYWLTMGHAPSKGSLTTEIAVHPGRSPTEDELVECVRLFAGTMGLSGMVTVSLFYAKAGIDKPTESDVTFIGAATAYVPPTASLPKMSWDRIWHQGQEQKKN